MIKILILALTLSWSSISYSADIEEVPNTESIESQLCSDKVIFERSLWTPMILDQLIAYQKQYKKGNAQCSFSSAIISSEVKSFGYDPVPSYQISFTCSVADSIGDVISFSGLCSNKDHEQTPLRVSEIIIDPNV